MMKGLALLAVLLCGCDLYFGGGDDDVCATTGGGAKEEPAYQARNPQTGQCEYIGGGWCDDACGPCPAVDLAYPDWGSCYSACEGLDPQSCKATSGCYTAYLDDPAADGRQYWGCWQTAPSGPVQGSCANLDAQSCSRHDNCSAVYLVATTTKDTSFEACEAEVIGEPPACDVINCGTGYHCEQQCSGTDPMMQQCQPACVADSTCANVDCAPGYTCAQACAPGPNGILTCGPACIPTPTNPSCETLLTEMSCIARTDCVPVYDGQNCTCYPDHCECQVLTYERCEPL